MGGWVFEIWRNNFDPAGLLQDPELAARIMRTEPQHADGLAPGELDALAACALLWREGGEAAGLPRVEPAPGLTPGRCRDGNEKGPVSRDTGPLQ